MRAAAQRFLHSEGGFTLPAPDKMHPSEIALTLSADVLRLPYLPAIRLVMAEIVSLHAATGLCDASDAHFAARLTISTDTASRAVKELSKDGLIVKVTSMTPTGLYRTLAPVPAAIAAKAQANPYPQSAGTPQNAGREDTRKMPVGYPQSAGTPTRKMPVGVPADCGSNIPFNIPVSFHQSSSTTPFGRGDAPAGPEAGEVPEEEELIGQGVGAEPALAPKKKVAAKKKGPTRPSRPEVPFEESEIASYEAFEAAFADTDYALANLRYYHEKIKNWRQKGEPPLRKDWKATATQFFLNDVRDNSLQLAPTTHYASSHGDAVGSGAQSTRYRSARHDR
jgi:hypothetical protein